MISPCSEFPPLSCSPTCLSLFICLSRLFYYVYVILLGPIIDYIFLSISSKWNGFHFWAPHWKMVLWFNVARGKKCLPVFMCLSSSFTASDNLPDGWIMSIPQVTSFFIMPRWWQTGLANSWYVWPTISLKQSINEGNFHWSDMVHISDNDTNWIVIYYPFPSQKQF